MADVVVAGAGIAGLTAALSFAEKGFSVSLFERAERLEETGAGLQLSPNATRILRSLGVLAPLQGSVVRPEAILLKDAARLLGLLARVPLGAAAETRWSGPYLVAHRADLQRALLACVRQQPAISFETGVAVREAIFGSQGVEVSLDKGGSVHQIACRLLVGADGVWSGLRKIAGGKPSRFTGHVAFRCVLPLKGETAEIVPPDAVTAFLAPGFHLVAYPVRGGGEVNLVAVARGTQIERGWANAADTIHLLKAIGSAAPELLRFVGQANAWTAWPIHAAAEGGPWTHPGGLALIGDAAHALTPYAAQGAAMAIEDAVLLAELAARENDMARMLEAFERLRRPRVARVVRRGTFNRFVWHARGPIALARNLALRARREESLAADLDWLYGHDVLAESAAAAIGQGRR